MVEQIRINPEEVRGYGNICEGHTLEDFIVSNSGLAKEKENVHGALTDVYKLVYSLYGLMFDFDKGNKQLYLQMGEADILSFGFDDDSKQLYLLDMARTGLSLGFDEDTNELYITDAPPIVHNYSLALDSESYTTTGSLSVSATLLDDGVAVSGATVSFTGGDSAVTATTNSSGVATATVNFTSSGTLTASYSNVSDTATVTVQQGYLFYDACDSSSGLSNYSLLTLRGSPSPTLTFDSTNSCYVLANNASASGGHSMMAIDSLAGENSYTMQFKTKPYNTTDNGGTGYAYKGSNGMYSIYYMYKTDGSDSGNITINQGSSDSKQTNIGSNHRDEWLTHILTVSNGKVTYVLKDSADTILYNGSAFSPSKQIQSDTKPGVTILWWDVSKVFVKEIIVEAL